MKFFPYKLSKVFNIKKHEQNFVKIHTQNTVTTISLFSKFLTTHGFFIKNKTMLVDIVRNCNYFFYNNCDFIFEHYPTIKWILEDFFLKKTDYTYIFNIFINLIKPPFVITTMLIPKKLKRKTKQKYLIKIVYRSENKRLKSSFKQLYYYSSKFTDSKFKVRLYKSMMYSFLDWKNSYLFRFKSMVFKKFFKF